MESSLELLLPIVPDFAGFSMEVLGTAIENMGKRGRQDPGSNLCHWLWDLISGDRNAFFIIPFPAHAAVIVHVGWLFENCNNTPSSGSVLQETEPEVWLLVTGRRFSGKRVGRQDVATRPHGCQPRGMGVGPGLRTRYCLLAGSLSVNAEAIGLAVGV